MTANPLDPIPLSGSANARVKSDSNFQLQNVAAGARLVQASGVPDGWTLEAVYLNGQDVIDTRVDFTGSCYVEGLRLVFSDQVSQLAGVAHDGQGNPLADFTVVAFLSNKALWQPRSRYIRASRPDQNTRHEIRGRPPGQYLLAAVEVVQQDEWFDPRFPERLRPRPPTLSLYAGESKDLNLTLDSQPQ